MPRHICHQDTLKIEDDVQVEIKSGVITITGPRGTLTKDLRHLKLDFEYDAEEKQVVARCWFGNRKHIARVGTLFGHIKNMVTGVTKGYRYKMRFVYSHFPIKHTISDNGDSFSFTHFMGQRHKKGLKLPEGTIIKNGPEEVKDEIRIEGNDIEKVSQTAARIHQFSHIKNKDLRKFLDGIYVSEKGNLDEE